MVTYQQIHQYALYNVHKLLVYLVKMQQINVFNNVLIIHMEIKLEIDLVFHFVQLLMILSGIHKLLNIYALSFVKKVHGEINMDSHIVKLFLLIVFKDNMLIIAQICVYLFALKTKIISEIQVLGYVLIDVLR
jgi:hypothetical protein